MNRRGKEGQDVVGYMNRLKNPNRQFMAKDQVFDFVTQKLDLSCSSSEKGETKAKGPGETKTGDKKPGQPTAPPMKKRTRGALVGFWGKGEVGHFVHLNAAIAVTLRALYFEGLSQDEAVDLVSFLCGPPHKHSVAQSIMWRSSFLRRYFSVSPVFCAT